MIESPELTLCHKTERVTIFKIPPLSTTKGYYLDDWKEMIWEGGVKVTEKSKVITVTFLTKDEKVFAQTKIPANSAEAIKKTNDSSRGYAVRLEKPNGGFLWVGVAFRDRNDAFDFGVVFQDFQSRSKLDANPSALEQEFGKDVDFSLKKGEKIKINMGKKKEDDGGFFSGPKKEEKEGEDWLGEGQSKKPKKKEASKNDFNLLDL